MVSSANRLPPFRIIATLKSVIFKDTKAAGPRWWINLPVLGLIFHRARSGHYQYLLSIEASFFHILKVLIVSSLHYELANRTAPPTDTRFVPAACCVIDTGGHSAIGYYLCAEPRGNGAVRLGVAIAIIAIRAVDRHVVAYRAV